jgi:hypothetical protein
MIAFLGEEFGSLEDLERHALEIDEGRAWNFSRNSPCSYMNWKNILSSQNPNLPLAFDLGPMHAYLSL